MVDVFHFGKVRVPCMFLAAGVASAIAPAEVLRVKLEDSSTNPAIAHMRITLDRETLTAGRVTFEAVNGSKVLKHEVVVVRERGTGELLIDPQHDQINEQAVRRLGEIADLAPGKTGKHRRAGSSREPMRGREPDGDGE